MSENEKVSSTTPGSLDPGVKHDEKIVETKICKHCQASFHITDKDLEFYEKVSPVFPSPDSLESGLNRVKKLGNGKIKYLIPSPTLCPDCRNQRRLCWRNDRCLYKRKCDETGKLIISIFSPDKPFIVYDLDFWWSDAWSIENYFLDLDIEKSLFSQFKELLKKVPKRALVKGTGTEKCEYTNLLGASKNCYLIFDSNNNENCFYGSGLVRCTNCIDIAYSRDCIYCYSIIDSNNCYNCTYLQNCNDCSDSHFLFNCNDCHNCFGCVNLNNKSYYIFNEEYSQDEYKKELQKLKEHNFSFKDFLQLRLKFPVQNLLIRNSENVTGNIIFNSKDVKNSFEVYDAENISYSNYVHSNAGDCFDVNVVLNDSFKIYDTGLINKNCSNIIFCYDCWNNCENLIYCTECKRTKNSFMCTGLVGKEYCILNKQYTKEEYEKFVPKIIEHMQKTGEWGEFFPSSLSPFGYNETVAQEYFPLDRDVAMQHLYNRSNYEAPFPKVAKIIPASKLPESVKEIPNDILNWAIECEITKKPFKIIKEELDFYRKHNLPIPKKHPDERHKERMSLRNPRKLFERLCDCPTCEENAKKSGNFKQENFEFKDPEINSGGQRRKIQTTYAPERPEIVYCQTCYEKEIY